MRGRNFLWRARSALHLLAGREDDRLRFEYQPELATLLRFRDSEKIERRRKVLKELFSKCSNNLGSGGYFRIALRGAGPPTAALAAE